MAKTAQRRRASTVRWKLPVLPNIGPGAVDAMKFREFVRADHGFHKLNSFEKALLAKPVNDVSDLLRIAEICRYYTETEYEKLEDFQ